MSRRLWDTMTIRSLFRFSPLAVLLAAVPSSALAQQAPGATVTCVCPGYAPAPPPAVVVVAPAQGWNGSQRWGLGLRLTSLNLRQEDDPDSAVQYAGGGLQLFYRFGL